MASSAVVPSTHDVWQKARILLMLTLTKTNDLKEIKRMFAEY